MKTLVYGGRNYRDQEFLERQLDSLGITAVVHGDAKGADRMAGEWAKKRQVPCTAYPANWSRDGRQAGYLRNARMLEQSRPDLLVGFPGGPGTRHMTNLAKSKGYRILLADPERGIAAIKET